MIYIPICFYFNVSTLHTRQLGSGRFTFQYVSILICKVCAENFRNCIYIPICFYFNTNQCRARYKVSFIYIPICFYFNWKVATNTAVAATFTFQYVSILILGAVALIFISNLFTFQYVSILIITLPMRYMTYHNLHSNMFLF